MRLLDELCVAPIGLVSVGLDIVMFFVLVHLITLHWPIRLLLAFDRVGQPLIDPLVRTVQRTLPSDWRGQEPRRTRMATAVALFAVSLCRFAISHAEHVAIVALS